MAQCGVCDSQLPMPRMPTSVRQAMWGGWSCRTCGSEVDAKGLPLAERTTMPDRVIFRSGGPPSSTIAVGVLLAIFVAIPGSLLGLPRLLPSDWNPIFGALLGFFCLFSFLISLTLWSLRKARGGRLATITSTQVEVDDAVIPYASLGLVGEGARFSIVHGGREIPMSWAPGLEEALRTAYDRFQEAQSGAEEESRGARAKLASLGTE